MKPEQHATNNPYIFIVDDNEVDRYLLKRILRTAGVTLDVVEAEDGDQALSYFENQVADTAQSAGTHWPLVVLLDINMPRKTGLEFLEDFAQLRGDNPAINSSVVMLSTTERIDEQQRALSYPFVKGYFTKGAVDPETLASLLHGIEGEPHTA